MDKIIKELEDKQKELQSDADYYDACGSAESSMQAQCELIGFMKAIEIVKNNSIIK